ncbi:Protein CBG28033 [Caenorhabditis briggsae]|uniref:Protein CBG28033 n=1 Tax=Caenorhabditis briggsae TaxID=6238 RepID=B6IG29_CAEBR|nr:Protein CBG28033 [Caenorhabditis briggsae]CAR98859.1 Protein CBG28033 [Caenorhabditis briggsae]
MDELAEAIVAYKIAFSDWRNIRFSAEGVNKDKKELCICTPEIILPSCRWRVCTYKRDAPAVIQNLKTNYQRYLELKHELSELRNYETTSSIQKLRCETKTSINTWIKQPQSKEKQNELEQLFVVSVYTEDLMRKVFEDTASCEMNSDPEFLYQKFISVIEIMGNQDLLELWRIDCSEIIDGNLHEDINQEMLECEKVANWAQRSCRKIDYMFAEGKTLTANCNKMFKKAIDDVDYNSLVAAYEKMKESYSLTNRILVCAVPICFQLEELNENSYFIQTKAKLYWTYALDPRRTVRRMKYIAQKSHRICLPFRDTILPLWAAKKSELLRNRKDEWDNGSFKEFVSKMQQVLWTLKDINDNRHFVSDMDDINDVVMSKHFEELITQACEPDEELPYIKPRTVSLEEKFEKRQQQYLRKFKKAAKGKRQPENLAEEVEALAIIAHFQNLRDENGKREQGWPMNFENAQKNLREKEEELKLYMDSLKGNTIPLNLFDQGNRPFEGVIKPRRAQECEKSTTLYEELLAAAINDKNCSAYQELSDEQMIALIETNGVNGVNALNAEAENAPLDDANDANKKKEGFKVGDMTVATAPEPQPESVQDKNEKPDGEPEAKKPRLETNTVVDISVANSESTLRGSTNSIFPNMPFFPTVFDDENDFAIPRLPEINLKRKKVLKKKRSTKRKRDLNEKKDKMNDLPKPASINHNIQAGYNAALRNLIYPDGLIDADGFAIPALPSESKTPSGCKIRIKINRDNDIIEYENVKSMRFGVISFWQKYVPENDGQVLEIKETDTSFNGDLDQKLFAPITNATYENLEPVSPVQVPQPEPNVSWIDDNSQYPKDTLSENGTDEVYVPDSDTPEGLGVLHPMPNQTEIHCENNDIDKENEHNGPYIQYHFDTEE